LSDEAFEQEQQRRLEGRLDAATRPGGLLDGCLINGCLIGCLPAIAVLIVPASLVLGVLR
jgi:hypothetical protein